MDICCSTVAALTQHLMGHRGAYTVRNGYSLPVLGQFRHVVATYIMPNLLVRVKTGSENNRGDLMVHISKPKS